MVRLQKYLADAGVASRRASEEIIRAGRVTVNGEVVRELGTKVEPGADQVAVDGRVLKVKRKLHLALNKPPRCVCTRNDPQGRPTIFEFLPKEWGNLFPVGRLDYASEGLLFVTNDGDFCLKLTHPRFEVPKLYRVTVEGRVEPRILAELRHGVFEGGERLRARRARLLSSSNSRSVLEIELTEGKNREIRRMLGTLGLTIERLQRIQIGRVKLGELRSGRWRTLTEPEIKSLLAEL